MICLLCIVLFYNSNIHTLPAPLKGPAFSEKLYYVFLLNNPCLSLWSTCKQWSKFPKHIRRTFTVIPKYFLSKQLKGLPWIRRVQKETGLLCTKFKFRAEWNHSSVCQTDKLWQQMHHKLNRCHYAKKVTARENKSYILPSPCEALALLKHPPDPSLPVNQVPRKTPRAKITGSAYQMQAMVLPSLPRATQRCSWCALLYWHVQWKKQKTRLRATTKLMHCPSSCQSRSNKRKPANRYSKDIF